MMQTVNLTHNKQINNLKALKKAFHSINNFHSTHNEPWIANFSSHQIKSNISYTSVSGVISSGSKAQEMHYPYTQLSHPH